MILRLPACQTHQKMGAAPTRGVLKKARGVFNEARGVSNEARSVFTEVRGAMEGPTQLSLLEAHLRDLDIVDKRLRLALAPISSPVRASNPGKVRTSVGHGATWQPSVNIGVEWSRVLPGRACSPQDGIPGFARYRVPVGSGERQARDMSKAGAARGRTDAMPLPPLRTRVTRTHHIQTTSEPIYDTCSNRSLANDRSIRKTRYVDEKQAAVNGLSRASDASTAKMVAAVSGQLKR